MPIGKLTLRDLIGFDGISYYLWNDVRLHEIRYEKDLLK